MAADYCLKATHIA